MLEIKLWAFWRAVLAECLGMIIYVFTGLSAMIGSHNNSFPDQEIKMAFAFGLATATLTQCIRHVSGGHLNPAVTLGMLATCQISFLRAFFYMVAQMLGAVAGSAMVYGVRPASTDSLGVNKVRMNPRVSNLFVQFCNKTAFNPKIGWYLEDCFQPNLGNVKVVSCASALLVNSWWLFFK